MYLILGSGKTYDFLATQFLYEYKNDVIQISPAYAGPRYDDSHTRWHKLESEVDEVTLLVGAMKELKEIVFTKVFLCVPEVDIDFHTLLTSHGLTSILKSHLIPYLYLLKQLISYKMKFSVLCEMPVSDDFELSMFYSVLRPLVSVALQGTSTTVEFYSKNILSQKPLEQWYNEIWSK